MSLIRWNPAQELATFPTDVINMQREMNKMFDNFFRRGTREDGGIGSSMWSPAVDVEERDEEYQVRVELPGVNKDDVRITMQDSLLTIRGEKKQEKESKNSSYHRLERSYGSFQRSFTLPTSVRHDKIEASYKEGILTIILPKAEEAKPKQIDVKVK